MKCDREQPCSQCIRSNRAEQCDYDENAGSLGPHWGENASSHDRVPKNPTSSTAFALDGSGNLGLTYSAIANTEIRQLRARISTLEGLVHAIDNPNPSTTVTPSRYEERPQVSKANYRGLSNTRSLMSLVCLLHVGILL